MVRASYLLFVDRFFVLPYRALRFLVPHWSSSKGPKGGPIVIKLLGQGSIIRLFSLYRAQGIDERAFTLITFDVNEEVCSLLEVPNVRYLSTTSLFDFASSLWKVVRFTRKEKPSWVIDLERASHTVGCFRFLLALIGNSKALGFDLHRALNHGRVKTINIDNASMKEIFEASTPLLPAGRKNQSSPVRHHPAEPNKVIININASHYVYGRRYPLELFEEVILELHRANRELSFYLSGSKSERSYTEQLTTSLQSKMIRVVNRAGEWGWADFASELQRCSVFITGDSGPLHLAAYLQVPTVAVWGPTQPWWFGYDAPGFRNATLNLPCSPCFRHPKSRPYRTCRGDITCMKNLKPQLVAREALQLIQHRVASGSDASLPQSSEAP